MDPKENSGEVTQLGDCEIGDYILIATGNRFYPSVGFTVKKFHKRIVYCHSTDPRVKDFFVQETEGPNTHLYPFLKSRNVMV